MIAVPSRNLDLVVAVALALLAAVSALVLPDLFVPFRIVSGLLLVLVLPGYCLMVAFFPAREAAEGYERLAVSIGLSIAIIPLIGLALVALPWGIGVESVVLALTASVVLTAVLALVRRSRLASAPAFEFGGDATFSRGLVFLFGGLLVTLLLFGIVQPQTVYTSFYLLGEQGFMEGFPSRLQPNESFSVTTVVENHERRRVEYTVRRIQADDGNDGEVLASVSLRNQEVWREPLLLSAPSEPGPVRVELGLFRRSDREPYRLLTLEIVVQAGGTR